MVRRWTRTFHSHPLAANEGQASSSSSLGSSEHPSIKPYSSNTILSRISMMACALAVAQPAALAPSGGSKNIPKNLPRIPGPKISGRMRSRRAVVAKAAQDSSETSESIVKYVQSSFSTPEDLFALAGIGFGAIAALWASINLVEVIDKIPVIPILFELIGILVAWFFIYQNLLFKRDREEFLKKIKSSVSRILGQ